MHPTTFVDDGELKSRTEGSNCERTYQPGKSDKNQWVDKTVPAEPSLHQDFNHSTDLPGCPCVDIRGIFPPPRTDPPEDPSHEH